MKSDNYYNSQIQYYNEWTYNINLTIVKQAKN